MNFSHRSLSIRQRCRSAGQKSQPFDHPVELKALVETVGERAEVTPDAPSSKRMIGPVEHGLDAAEHGVDPGELCLLDAGRFQIQGSQNGSQTNRRTRTRRGLAAPGVSNTVLAHGYFILAK